MGIFFAGLAVTLSGIVMGFEQGQANPQVDNFFESKAAPAPRYEWLGDHN